MSPRNRDYIFCLSCDEQKFFYLGVAMAKQTYGLPSKKTVRRAGEVLRSSDSSQAEKDLAIDVLSQWRSLFYRPINTFQALIRKKIKDAGIKNAIVAQRLKRTPSIVTKLKRFPDMQLDRMQDIGGVRAVLNSVDEVRKIHSSLVDGRHKHSPVLPPKDYITEPKQDGYRGIHQVFKYSTTQHAELKGMQVEVQIRTKLQHYWATAVETIGVIEKSSFKTGLGDEKFKQFFRLSSALFSIQEQEPVVALLRDKSKLEIAEEFSLLEKELGVFDKLAAFTSVVKAVSGVENKKANGYYLLMLDTDKKLTSFIPFAADQQDIAEQVYTLVEQREKENPNIDVVLAAAGDMKDLRTAYPNYFVDTKAFISSLKQICAEITKN